MSTDLMPGSPPREAELDRRIEKAGWGLFAILMGALWLVPPARLPDGAWLIGIGLLLLGLNVARRWMRIAIHGLSTAVGVIALGTGLGLLAGYQLPFLAFFLIAVGIATVADAALRRRR